METFNLCVQAPVRQVFCSVTMAIVTNQSRHVTSLTTVEMGRMKWIVGHPARLNMGAVVGKAAWQTPLVGLLELVLSIGSDLLMTTHSRMKVVKLL